MQITDLSYGKYVPWLTFLFFDASALWSHMGRNVLASGSENDIFWSGDSLNKALWTFSRVMFTGYAFNLVLNFVYL